MTERAGWYVDDFGVLPNDHVAVAEILLLLN